LNIGTGKNISPLDDFKHKHLDKNSFQRFMLILPMVYGKVILDIHMGIDNLCPNTSELFISFKI